MTFAPSVATLVIVRAIPPDTTAKADAGAVTELSASLKVSVIDMPSAETIADDAV
jgi:hypothetical protein